MLQEEDILIHRLRKGDAQAFEQLFTTWYEKLCLFAFRIINDIHSAEEIVADIYTGIWEKKETLLITTSFRSYMYKAVRNRCLNHIKHQHIEKEYVRYVLQDQSSIPEHSDPAQVEELEREVMEAVESLPEKCRQIFKLSRYENLKYRDIAHKLDLSPKTIERQMMIALKKLRNQLKHLVATF